MQSRHAAQHVGGIRKTPRVHIEPSTIGENRATEPHTRPLAHRNQARIATVDQVVSKHEPEMSRTVQNKGNEGKAYSPDIGNSVLRVAGLLDISVCSIEAKDGHFRQQTSCIAEMVCRSGRGHTRPLCGRA